MIKYNNRVAFDYPISATNLATFLADELGLQKATCENVGGYTDTWILYKKDADLDAVTGVFVGSTETSFKVCAIYNGTLSGGNVVQYSSSTPTNYILAYIKSENGCAFSITNSTTADSVRGVTCMVGTAGNYGVYAINNGNSEEAFANGGRFFKTQTNATNNQPDIVGLSPLIVNNLICDNLYITEAFPSTSDSQQFTLNGENFISMRTNTLGYEKIVFKEG